MIDIIELRDKYIEEKFTLADANAKVAQDLLLLKISKIKFSNNITIKGGVVMQSLSNDYRRATRDIDLDFIKYSLEDDSIRKFIDRLNTVNDGIKITITEEIEPLNHQDYKGKRVLIELKDSNGNKITTKLDLGVHKDYEIIQEEYWFNFNNLGESAKLLINSKEQIFVEKLKSLMKQDFLSTRYKDIFDFYYLINMTDINKDKLLKYIEIYIFKDKKMKETTVLDIYNKLNSILNNEIFARNLSRLKNNWLEFPAKEVIKNILEFFERLETVNV